MPYSTAFFDLQLQFARCVAEKRNQSLEDVLYDFTTISRSIDLVAKPYDTTNPVWQAYIKGLKEANDATNWTYEFYLQNRNDVDLTPEDTEFHGNKLFGCFYFVIRDDHIVRPHIIKINDGAEHSLLSRHRKAEQLQNLKAMFQHTKDHVPGIDTVRGNSWMYNLEAYRRLFPPQYTRNMPESPYTELPYLARWGQFFDKDWNVKPDMAQRLFDRLATWSPEQNLKDCFPFQILNPKCDIQHFYDFYNCK